MKKKVGVLLYILIAMFMIVGWEKKEVELLVNGKLIDLGYVIGLAKPGGSAGDSEEESESLSENNAAEGEDNSKVEIHTDYVSMNEVNKNIEIKIRGEKISYSCGIERSDNILDTQLESAIRSDLGPKTKVTLIDDYAEAHAYRNVRRILDKLKNNTGLTYVERADGGE